MSSEQNLRQIDVCRRQFREPGKGRHENARNGFEKPIESVIDSIIVSTHNRLVRAQKLTFTGMPCLDLLPMI